MEAGSRPGTMCVSVICHPPLSSQTCHTHQQLLAGEHIPVHAHTHYRPLGVRAYSKTYKSKRRHKCCGHTQTLSHTVLGWYVEDLVTHCLFNFKKLRRGWEHLGQRGHQSEEVIRHITASCCIAGCWMWNISTCSSLKGDRSPLCSVLTYFVCSIALISVGQTYPRLHHCVSDPFHLHALSANCRGENVGNKWGRRGDHILASMGWYVTLSFWILLSTLDRQLNKKTHRLPMCLHGSWFSWKQWEGWNAECAKPWSGVWGWVHHIYTGPQAKGENGYVALAKSPFSITIRHLTPTLFLIWMFHTATQAQTFLQMQCSWSRRPQNGEESHHYAEGKWPFRPRCQLSLCASKLEGRG